MGVMKEELDGYAIFSSTTAWIFPAAVIDFSRGVKD